MMFLNNKALVACIVLMVFAGCETNEPEQVEGNAVIRFGINEESVVTLTIENSYNTIVRTLINGENRSAGYHEVTWDFKDDDDQLVIEGIYFYRLVIRNSETFISVRPLVLGQ